ncbi:MAG: cysteine desulfurase family protein [Saprospiraceae bacterium]
MTRVYFDNASTTPLHPEVKYWMCSQMNEEFGNPSSIHYHGRKAKSIIEASRKTIATILKASLGEIFFTSSASEANNMILKNAVESFGVKRIITSPTEHPCVLKTLVYLQEKGLIKVEFLPVDSFGRVDIDILENKLLDTKEKTLVSIMHGNNEIGSMIDLGQISSICHQNGALFHCDTVQTLGKYEIDLSKNHLNFMSGSAHKFHGPKGVGFVYIRNTNIISPYIHGGAQERNMRAGTENVLGIGGMALALELSFTSREENKNHILHLRELFKKGLVENFLDIQFNGNQQEDFLAHILNVSFPPGPKADLLLFNLDIAGISCSSASACSSGIESDSHVLQAIQHDPLRKAIRFSFSPLNTQEEVLYALEQLEQFTPLR